MFLEDKKDGKVRKFAPLYRVSPFWKVDISSYWDSLRNPVEIVYSYYPHEITDSNWDSLINTCPNQTVNFYFITEETMRSKTWDEICKDQLYVKKVKFHLSDLTIEDPIPVKIYSVKYSMSEEKIKKLKDLLKPRNAKIVY